LGESNTTGLSIVIPCLNEERTIPQALGWAFALIESSNLPGEVIVADNGSTDSSVQLAVQLGARVVTVPQRGYGSALDAGIKAAQGNFIVMGDADGSYDFRDALPMMVRLQSGADLVVGNRFQGGIHKSAMPLLHRYLGNPVLSLIARALYRAPVGDVYCGLRAFRKDKVQGLQLSMAGMEFAIEMVVRAQLSRLCIEEVPVELHPDGRDRKPHLRTWSDGWRSLRFLILLAPSWIFLGPGFLMILLGGLVGVRILLGAVGWMAPWLQHHSLILTWVTVLCGFQLVFFGVGVRVFAVAQGIATYDATLRRFFSHFNLGSCALLSVLLLLGGVVGIAEVYWLWASKDYGRLEYEQTLAIVIPSAAAIAIGLQLLVSSFFVSTLSLTRIVRREK
jgi:hypothetical protein